LGKEIFIVIVKMNKNKHTFVNNIQNILNNKKKGISTEKKTKKIKEKNNISPLNYCF